MKKFITLFLVFSLLALSGNLYAKKKGAEIVIQKTDGTKVRGELIAVKQNSMLLTEFESGMDVSVDTDEMELITIVKQSKTGKGALYGFLIGGGIGIVLGYTADPDTPPSREATAAIVGISVGLIGALFGGMWGSSKGKPETTQIEGKSASEIKEILEKLRKKARVKNFQ